MPTLKTSARTPPLAAVDTLASEFETWDGARLFYRSWNASEPRSRFVVLFHGGHEHSGRFDDLVARLALEDTAVFAWDARGHGLTNGERGFAPHFHHLVKDAEAFVRFLEREHGLIAENTVVLGHSVGSVVVSTWLCDYAPRVRGAVLSSPAFEVKLYVPLALAGLRLLERVKPHSFIRSYVRPGMLTHDEEEAEARRRDELISPQIAVSVLTSLFETSKRVIADASSIRTPVLLLSAGKDWIVHKEPQRRFFERLGSTTKKHIEYDELFHELFHEKDRDEPIGEAKRFIESLFDTKADRNLPAAQSLDASAHEALARPLSLASPTRWLFAMQRAFLRSVGRLSRGIRLGWETGFDSGTTLDYVYENRPRGVTPLGRLIDRIYLDSVGWRGIRKRREHLVELLLESVEDSLTRTDRAHVVDIASGAGRYLLDTLEQLDGDAITVLCRDRDEASLVTGRREADARGIEHVRFETGDAFDSESLQQLAPRPDVVVVSGLWELFPDNDELEKSLAGIRDAIADGGSLIYTNQPWHPQLEMIARTLINRDGEPWVMRCRKQSEIDELVASFGFRKVAMRIDDTGIFSVSRAVRIADR
jgi:alpha-beta hydrolase superfamily lysophospholipase/SAM-dependent methyltransferase